MTGPKLTFQNVLNYLTRRGQTREAAEDLVQEAWTRLLEYYRDGGGVRNEEAFVKKTAEHLSIDQYRHGKRYPVAEGDIGELEQTLALDGKRPPPDEVLAMRQRLFAIRDGLNAVSKRSGDIYMAQAAGYTHKEIAAYYKISCSAVEKHIARAVQWLMDQEDPL